MIADPIMRRRELEQRRQRIRLRLRPALLPVFLVGLWLIGSQVLKSASLPSPALVLLGFVLVCPFLLTFYSDN